jgi:hypothetical protein
MIKSKSQRVDSDPAPRRSAEHLYSVGQAVRLKAGFGLPLRAGEIYRITATLPLRDSAPQYRIRSEGEPHERVTTEDNLELVVASKGDSASALIERTFGHGQGKATQ